METLIKVYLYQSSYKHSNIYNKGKHKCTSISIEFLSDLKGNYKSVEHLIDIADDVMYKIKINKKSKIKKQ